MHPCAEGVDDAALQDIADHAELVRYEPGEVVHRAEDVLTSVYFIVQGRLKCTAYNLNGQPFLEKIYSRGEQFGGLGAALAEPLPIHVTAHSPAVLLCFEYQTSLQLTLAYPTFRKNVARLVARSVGQVVFGDRIRKKSSLVTFCHESPATRPLTIQVIRRLQELGENVCLVTDDLSMPELAGVRCHRLVEQQRKLSYQQMRDLVSQWSDADRVFFDLRSGNADFNPHDVLLLCEQVFWCIRPDDWQQAAQGLRQIQEITPVWREKIGVVWLLNHVQPWAPAVPELRELAVEDYKVSLDQPKSGQSQVLAHGLQRLVHQLRGIRIGVALGGGAARGMAHLGVLKALEQNGIVVDMLAGTSAGAMTGTLLAAGMDHDYCIDSFVTDLTPSRFFRLLPHGDQWFLLYKYRRGQFDPMLRKYLQETTLEQLPLPLRTVTVDLITGCPVVRDSGDAVQAILESINLPVLSSPICREGAALVDGGLVNNVPANVLVDEGCNFVIAVSVTAKLENRFGKNQPDTPTEKMKSPSTLHTILRSHIVQSMNMNSVGVQPADVVIAPDVTNYELTAFTKTDELADIGERATRDMLPQINQLLHKLDSQLFPHS